MPHSSVLSAALQVTRGVKQVNEQEFVARMETLAEDAFDDQCTGANPR